MINNAQSRTKDMQTRMEVAWNRERSEQKRLLTEAHYLAIDLQKQLKYRDDEHLQEKRVLLDQLKRLRNQLDEEQISRREQLSQVCTHVWYAYQDALDTSLCNIVH
jgi:TPP-dependent pyruvate/acetoin dehydrogenase alpha subunit